MSTTSNRRRRSVISSAIACDWSSSDGLGGIGPAGEDLDVRVSSSGWRASSSFTCPISTLVVPTAPSTTEPGGQHRATQVAVDEATLWPAMASVIARFTVVVDFPSPGSGLDTTNMRLS